MILSINDNEKEILKTALESYEKDLKGEIGKTDDRDLRTILHGEDEVLRELLKKVA